MHTLQRLFITSCAAAALSVGMVVAQPAAQARPADATAQCKDGTYSTAKTRRGACAGHGGVQTWYAGENTKADTKAAAKSTPARPRVKALQLNPIRVYDDPLLADPPFDHEGLGCRRHHEDSRRGEEAGVFAPTTLPQKHGCTRVEELGRTVELQKERRARGSSRQRTCEREPCMALVHKITARCGISSRGGEGYVEPKRRRRR